MFSTKQTRLILFLTIIISILISAIGLNWRQDKKEEEAETKAALELPGYIKEQSLREPVPAKDETSPSEKEEPEEDEEEDEGTTITF